MWGKKKKTLEEQQEETRRHFHQAVANHDFNKQEDLFHKLIILDKKIKKRQDST